MTREEAIKGLKVLRKDFSGYKPNEEMFDMAIEALSAEPSAEPETITAYWKKDAFGAVFCSKCGGIRRDNRVGHVQWCNSCGCFMRGEQDE